MLYDFGGGLIVVVVNLGGGIYLYGVKILGGGGVRILGFCIDLGG